MLICNSYAETLAICLFKSSISLSLLANNCLKSLQFFSAFDFVEFKHWTCIYKSFIVFDWFSFSVLRPVSDFVNWEFRFKRVQLSFLMHSKLQSSFKWRKFNWCSWLVIFFSAVTKHFVKMLSTMLMSLKTFQIQSNNKASKHIWRIPYKIWY